MPKDTHVLQVTVFTPHEGQLDAFVRRQLEGLAKFGDIPGSRGSRFYRSLDNRTAVLISSWDSTEDVQRFGQTELFAAHRATLLSLLESASSGAYELVYERRPEMAV
ncbi:MAG TPA: antibiotic biosynthesis monooxygenase [Caulobacteraceae bacterium]|jgi:heme-degrading monooxygenase HmoA|nr:antibiotic biosynthesis monooxygenase [Caulobacteraceae bacterium]